MPRPSDVSAAWTNEDGITARKMGWWQTLAADGKTDDGNEYREKPPFYNAPTAAEADNPLGPRSGEKLEDMYLERREFQDGRREDRDPHGWFDDGVSFNDETFPAEVPSQLHIPSPSVAPPDLLFIGPTTRTSPLWTSRPPLVYIRCQLIVIAPFERQLIPALRRWLLSPVMCVFLSLPCLE